MAGRGDEEEVESSVIRVPSDVKALLDAARIGDESYGSVLRRLLMPGSRRAAKQGGPS